MNMNSRLSTPSPTKYFRGIKYLISNHYAATVLLALSLQAMPILACQPATDSDSLVIGNFSMGGLRNWEPIKFSAQTDYKIVDLDGKKVLRAQSLDTASGLIYKQRIDLLKTPVINWCWRVDQGLANDREKQREGDDYAARLYIVVDGGLFIWRSKALNYVWTSQLPVDDLWQNPYAGKSAMMLAIRSNTSPTGIWFSESRNIYHDLQRAFGFPIRYIDAIAIMTDTDDTSASALTYYGDIFLSRH